VLSALRFQNGATASTGVVEHRADVACFIGYVARRSNAPLPNALRLRLQRAGWARGVWLSGSEATVNARLESLDRIPVAVESWEEFDRLFAWDERQVVSGNRMRCATYLGAAVRAFFAHGGKRAYIVRVGNPWAYVGGSRTVNRARRLATLVPQTRFDPLSPGSWRGVQHLYGLGDVSHVCLPDLTDVFAEDPTPPSAARETLSYPETFVECSAHEPTLPDDTPIERVSAPRLDIDGFEAWHTAIGRVRAFIDLWRRDTLLVAALPLPIPDAATATGATLHAQADWFGFLQRVGILGDDDTDDRRPRNALSQLLWPWLRTTRSTDLPQFLESPEGSFLGVLAANAISRGTFRSVAGTRLPDAIACVPTPELGQGDESPSTRLAQRVCLIGPQPEGIMILSDVTVAKRSGWRSGGASRLIAAILRAVARIGETAVFEPNGPELWARLKRDVEALLEAFRLAGGLGGVSAADAYDVRCDRSLMSQNDLDNGRVRVDVAVLPVASVEKITIALELRASSASGSLSEVA
jgi:hypothetical protein